MCGIFGYVLKESNKEILNKANIFQSHRGPDGYGYEIIKVGDYYIGLAHQRLSIIDLSSSGSQPMQSYAGKNLLCFNGEIYNYKELRLEEKIVSSAGDTRVLVELLSRHGTSACEKLNGMWAFAFLDQTKGTVTLSRDRFGEKPLYLFSNSEGIYFASELKTLLELVPGKFDLNYQVIGEFLVQGLTDFSQASILKGVFQIAPGSNLSIDLFDSLNRKSENYWVPKIIQNNRPLDDSIEELINLFQESVNLRLRSDVPVAVLLSGGIDSSAITASMKNILSPEKVRTLSAVNEIGMDEKEHIDSVNYYLGSKPTLVNVNPDANEALKLMELAIFHNDMPISDFSNVAHLSLMKKAASMGVKVVLSGQGADEIFCGYKKYVGFYAQQLLREKKYLEVQKMLINFLFNKTVINQFKLSEARRYLPFLNSDLNILGENMSCFAKVPVGLQDSMKLSDRQLYDLKKTSVPALTHYEDRMSMANGIEIRLPFLDHRLVEFALNLPETYKLQKGWTKYILRRAVDKKLPNEVSWRKDKQGFLNPQANWLKKEWKPIVKEHLFEDSIISGSGIVKKENLAKTYDYFCQDKGNIWYRSIFAPFSLEIWLRRNMEKINL